MPEVTTLCLQCSERAAPLAGMPGGFQEADAERGQDRAG